MTDLVLRYALAGDLEAWVERNKRAYLQAVADGVYEEAREARDWIRGDVRAAGLAPLDRSFRIDSFPGRGRLAYEPAALVWSRAPQIIAAFEEGATIGPKSAGALVIPIEGSPAERLKSRPGMRLVDVAAARFGELKPIVNPATGQLLLAAEMQESGRTGRLARLTTKTHRSGGRFSPVAQRRTLVPLFRVVRQVRLDKRLDIAPLARAVEDTAGPRIERRIQRRIDEAAAGGAFGGPPAGQD